MRSVSSRRPWPWRGDWGGPSWRGGPRARRRRGPSLGRTRQALAGRSRIYLGSALRASAGRWSQALLLAVGAAVAVVSLDGYQKALLAVHYYACQRQWPEVLRASRRCTNDYTVMNAVDRALYHTGRLNQDMFAHMQYPEALIFTGADHALFYWHKLDTLIDLGLLNLAEKNLTECMEMFGEQPMILQRLAARQFGQGQGGGRPDLS